jgi:integrase
MSKGRKPQHFRDRNGVEIHGLARRPSDDRWRIIATGYTWTEPDEDKAIRKFRKLIGEKVFDGLGLSPEDIAFLRMSPADIIDSNAATAIGRGFALVGKADEAWPRFWRYVAEQIRTKPKWVAEQTGIEEIGYLSKLKPIVPAPLPATLRKTFEDYSKATRKHIRETLRAWDEFIEATKIEAIEDIDNELAVAYRDEVYARDLAPKTQKNLFVGVRAILKFNQKRAIATETIEKALIALKLLTPNGTSLTFDPKPISVDDFQKLLGKATGDMRAFVLLMLNCAMYMQEAIRLQWSDINNGCLVTNRQKVGKCIRAAVLWPETIEALNNIERKGDHIFISSYGTPIGISGMEKRFRMMRGFLDVSSSQLRDGAATAAAQAKVPAKFQSLLLGHRCGIGDHYVKRDPSQVKAATDAVHDFYFGKGNATEMPK